VELLRNKLNNRSTLNLPVSISSPTNIFAIPDTTIVVGIDIFWLPVMLANICRYTKQSISSRRNLARLFYNNEIHENYFKDILIGTIINFSGFYKITILSIYNTSIKFGLADHKYMTHAYQDISNI
jgi:hypothetical protein